MQTLPLKVRCTKCRKSHVRSVKVIEPEKFSPNGAKSVMSQFWCPLCNTIIAVRYAFGRNKEGEVTVRVKNRLEPVGVAFLHEIQAEAKKAQAEN